MKTYKNIVHYALSAVVAISMSLSFTSCEVLLKEEAYNFYDLEEMLKNTDRLEMAVNGIYEVFSDQQTYGQYWMVYDSDTDITHIQGPGLGHTARDLGHYNIYIEHAWLQETWAIYYAGIDRANTILSNQNLVTLQNDTTDKDRFDVLIAEAHCLRAMCYFDLTLLFGDVPLTLKPSEAEDNFLNPRTDRKVVFDQILSDFDTAVKGLKYHSEGSSYTGRLTKGAALGLYARANLYRAGYFLGQDGQMQRYDDYMTYFQNVIDITEELIQSGEHGLLSSYEQIFKNMCELKLDPTENLWEVPFFNTSGQKKHSSMMGTYNGPSINIDSSYGRANSFIKTHGIFYNTFVNLSDADNNVYTDTRRKVAIATFQIDANDEIKEINENQSYNWAPGKWRRN